LFSLDYIRDRSVAINLVRDELLLHHKQQDHDGCLHPSTLAG